MSNIDKRLLEVLKCPECGKKLFDLEQTQTISCGNHTFSVIEGIPSFGNKSYFEDHWDKNHSETTPTGKKVSAAEFLKPLSNLLSRNSNLRILDAGCGNCVHLQVLTEASEHFEYDFFVSMDISLGVLKNTRLDKSSNRLFVHGDIQKLPFLDSQFDAVFSYGALCYTDDPQKSFAELSRVLKNGGLLGLWVYPKKYGLSGFIFLMIRNFCRITGPIGARIIADLIVPFLAFLPTNSRLNICHATWRQCREVVLVNIAPAKLYFPVSSEVEAWFLDNNLKIIQNDRKSPINIWGVKY